jgi:hypothetical protein
MEETTHDLAIQVLTERLGKMIIERDALAKYGKVPEAVYSTNGNIEKIRASIKALLNLE